MSTRAILFRRRGGWDAQLEHLRGLDGSAQLVHLGSGMTFDADCDDDDWIVVRASDLAASQITLEMEDLRIDIGKEGPRCVSYRGRLFSVTVLELRILCELVRAKGKPVRRANLLLECWHSWTEQDFGKLEAAMSRLRRKLHAATHLSVEMDRGLGYRLASRNTVHEMPRRSVSREGRVLVVEADRALRRALVRHLTRLEIQFEVDTASTVARAALLLRKQTYTAILLDARLGDGSGLSLLPIQGTPVMVLANDRAALERAKRLGATECWMKLGDPAAVAAFAMRAFNLMESSTG